MYQNRLAFLRTVALGAALVIIPNVPVLRAQGNSGSANQAGQLGPGYPNGHSTTFGQGRGANTTTNGSGQMNPYGSANGQTDDNNGGMTSPGAAPNGSTGVNNGSTGNGNSGTANTPYGSNPYAPGTSSASRSDNPYGTDNGHSSGGLWGLLGLIGLIGLFSGRRRSREVFPEGTRR